MDEKLKNIFVGSQIIKLLPLATKMSEKEFLNLVLEKCDLPKDHIRLIKNKLKKL